MDLIYKLSGGKRINKSMFYSRIRQYFPMKEISYFDDRDMIDDAEVVKIDWPSNIAKPRVGLVKDIGIYPRWTKYCRFLENNNIEYEFYNIHSDHWIEDSARYNLIIGIVSSNQYHLIELQQKYYILEKYLGKKCFPNTDHLLLYENKRLEAYLSKIHGLPFATTYVSHDKDDALAITHRLKYPIISKVDPTSGSVGVELIKTPSRAKKIIERAFSLNGRKVYVNFFKQKNYIYFQEYVPNDGYDIRVILIGNLASGYYRKIPPGDFRASGMALKEKRELPKEAIDIAIKVNKYIKSPLLVVDLVHGLDNQYKIIEFSPVCRVTTAEELNVHGVPGIYVVEKDGSMQFKEGKYWIHELALREFLLNYYLSPSE